MSFLDDLLGSALAAADAAAEIHRRHARPADPGEWAEKGRADWVSEVDREAERVAVETIRRQFPDHAIAAEESDWGGPAAAEAEVTWYIDPLDGTTNYLHSYPYHAVSIAALDAAGPAAAVVLNSARSETFSATRGGGARLDGRPISVSRVTELGHALIGTGFPFKKLELLDEYQRQFAAILRRSSGIRRTGSAAIDLCDLAVGRLDGFWELHLAPWDVAGGALIVREAGGRFSGLDGEERVDRHGGFLAGNPAIYSELQRLLAAPTAG